MTHNIQTSTLFTSGRLTNGRRYPSHIYNVVVNTEEDGSFEYEVEADTFAEATEIAEEMANSLESDITFIEVYCFE